MEMKGKLRFTADGRWMHDEEYVTHQGVADYFSNHLEYDVRQGHFVVSDGIRALVVEVEDTPVVVRTISENSEGQLQLELNGQRTDRLRPETLRCTASGVWYVKVFEELLPARLLPNAVQLLVPYLEERCGAYYFCFAGKEVPITYEE